MKWTYEVTADDYLSARRLARRPRRLVRVLLAIVAVMMLLVGGVQVREALRSGHMPREFWILLAALAYIVFVLYVMLPKLIRKAFDQNKALSAPVTIEVYKGDLTVDSNKGKSTIRLKDLRGWKVNGRVAILYHAKGEFHIVPLRIFGADDRKRFLKDVSDAMGHKGS